MAYRNFAGAWLPDTNQAGVKYVNGSWFGETLYGSSGADQFEGGGGRDTFVGGAGDDFYWVRDTRDVVVEEAGGGVDTVKIWSSYVLSANVENLIVFGHGSYAAGNDGDNIIQGLDGDQFLYGGKGQDVLIGGPGADTFIVRQGEGNEVIEDFQSWSDKIRLIGGSLNTFDEVKAAMTQQGADVVLTDGATQIVFRNATVGQFAARDFQLPLEYGALGAPTFVDNFDSLQIGSVWKTNFGYAGDGLNSFTLPRNGEQQIYVSPDFKGTADWSLGLNPYAVKDGVLTITAQPVSAETSGKMWGYQYASGMLDSHYQQTYGYFEIRAELPHGQGLWPAFWLLGENNDEIDILEGLGSDTKVPYNAIHSNSVPAAGLQNFTPDDNGFHTYGALWSPQDIIFYIDGTEVWRTATPVDMHEPMHMIVNLAVGGHWAGAPDATTPWPAAMKVDYVKAWNLPDPNYTPGTGGPPPSPPPAGDAGRVLTATRAGDTLVGGTGADTLNASQGADQLTGGAGADSFVFRQTPWSAGHIKDFQVGVDRLDLSALPNNGAVTFEGDGAGGTKVMLDTDGPGGEWPFHIVTLNGIAPAGLTAASVYGQGGGTTPPTTPPPATTGQHLVSKTYGDVLVGGADADTLTAGQGPDRLTGGAGADRFDFDALPWTAGLVTDFRPGEDKLDLTGLRGVYTGGNLARDLAFVDDGAGGAKVMLDIDGPGGEWPFHITTLGGVAPGNVTAADWLL
ncbi:family 16 glycosylhydrolase [Phenylobacterium sp. J367]|uniref:family 16 glycosylhydrolase n=1 Tax=Phenylobacterium sp. J367 TaxID=2898435 RepID=UPI002150C896|nr:family 16 glycosylhydrolase [Phenylobacterium sp. J367]MCR5880054.1 family 16 glycosylhydrolase [Phenylobacterium sp. J367]